ncbi:MAG TPA: hypothetical protein VMV69_26915, partial [Pirellulales bacterium]|nr:hypothetical protein [Pirellulales bacterium]HUY36398.1 hypothetical protein [Pirellulales bacterium]
MGHNTTTADAASRIVRTPSAAASALGIDRGTLYEWFRKGCPREEGRFDVDAIAAWRETTLRPATNEARRREPRAQVPGPIHDVVEVAMRFARD